MTERYDIVASVGFTELCSLPYPRARASASTVRKRCQRSTHMLTSTKISAVKLYVCSGSQQTANRMTTVVSILMTCAPTRHTQNTKTNRLTSLRHTCRLSTQHDEAHLSCTVIRARYEGNTIEVDLSTFYEIFYVIVTDL